MIIWRTEKFAKSLPDQRSLANSRDLDSRSGMGEITRRGYRIEWFIGDHGPTHVHVYDAKERFLGRLDLQQMRGIEGWLPSKN